MSFKRIFHTVVFAGLAGFSIAGLTSCNSDDNVKDKQETVDKKDVKKHNREKFNSLRSQMKFALASVENFSDTAYDAHDGKWTVGYGCTVLYGADGKCESTKKDTKCSMSEADVYMGRYLTHEVLPDVSNYIQVPLNDEEMLATCLFRYCVGHANFCKSQYLKALNDGLKGAELAKCLTGFRQQSGVLKRLYFPAAMLCHKMTFDDLLDLRAEGCYNLYLTDICKTSAKRRSDNKDCLILTQDGFAVWDFDKLQNNLEIASQERTSKLGKCKKTKLIVCDYIVAGIVSGHKDTGRYDVLYDSALNEFCNGNSERALELYGKLEETSYNPALIQNDKSVVYYSKGDYKKALKTAKKALKVSEDRLDSAASWYNMGMAHDKSGCYHVISLNYLREAEKLNPDNKAVKEAIAEIKPKAQAQTKTIQHSVYGTLIALFVLGIGWVYFVGPDKTKELLQHMKRRNRGR